MKVIDSKILEIPVERRNFRLPDPQREILGR
jgi:hypothetical protein